MSREEVKKILDQQLELLAKQSKKQTIDSIEIVELTLAMVEALKIRLDKFRQ